MRLAIIIPHSMIDENREHTQSVDATIDSYYKTHPSSLI